MPRFIASRGDRRYLLFCAQFDYTLGARERLPEEWTDHALRVGRELAVLGYGAVLGWALLL